MKNKLILMLGIVLLVSFLFSAIPIVAGYTEYHTPDITHVTGTWTNPGSVYDNDWDTYGYITDDSTVGFIYINYSLTSVANAIWQIKDATSGGKLNLTIPDSCINQFSNVISLAVYSEKSGGGTQNKVRWYCNNGSFAELRTTGNIALVPSAYEESLFTLSPNVPIITANATYPDPALPTQDWQVNITATSSTNATFTAWAQFYINSTVSGSEISKEISNNTNTNIANLSAASINDGDILIAEVWIGNVDVNSTKINLSSSLADITYPIITPDDISLNRTFVYLNNNLTAQINASDANLYSINVSIDTTSIFNTTNYVSSLYVYNLSRNVSSFGVGLHNLSMRACDGHTTTSLKDEWDYDVGFTGLTFKDSKKWYKITPKNSDWFDKISTTKLTDRYTFEYSKSAVGKLLTGDTYTFVVESSEYIDIINKQESEYNAWMVIPSMERWIDFNLKGVKDAKYGIKRLNGRQVEVTITNVPAGIKELVFESTGELNCITKTYDFYIFDYNLTHELSALETSNQTFILTITRDPDFIDYANATLYWNGTAYPESNTTKTTTNTSFVFTQNIVMPSVDVDSYFLFNWNFNVTGNSTTTINTSNFNQTVYSINFDDCTIYNVTALNFSLIRESNNASIAGDMDFTFTLVGEAVARNYSKSVTGVNSTRFCISTNQVNFTAQLHSEYGAAGYDSHTYFAYNLPVNNDVTYIYYYLINGTTIVTFTVTDQDSNDLEDAYIKIMKYNIGTGLYKTIEVLKTDEQGEALGNIVLDTEWYKFMVEYNGITYLDTSATKITTTSRTFRINLLSDFFDRYTDIIYNIYSTLNYTNATSNFAFTYSDPSGDYHYGCLKVTKRTLAGDTLINETCVASTAATILVNINSTGAPDGTYLAVGYIMFDDIYILRTLTETFGSLSDKFGKEGLFYVFLIVLVCVMVAVFSPAIAIVLAIIGLVFSNILGFYYTNAGWLVALILAAGLTLYRMRRD